MTKDQLNTAIEKAYDNYIRNCMDQSVLSAELEAIKDENGHLSNSAMSTYVMSKSFKFSKHLIYEVLSDVLDIQD